MQGVRRGCAYPSRKVTRLSSTGDRTIGRMWREAVAASRDEPAYLVKGPSGAWEPVSWAGAGRAVDELANGLLARGVKKGDAFGIVSRTRLEGTLFDFALRPVGAVTAP